MPRGCPPFAGAARAFWLMKEKLGGPKGDKRWDRVQGCGPRLPQGKPDGWLGAADGGCRGGGWGPGEANRFEKLPGVAR